MAALFASCCCYQNKNGCLGVLLSSNTFIAPCRHYSLKTRRVLLSSRLCGICCLSSHCSVSHSSYITPISSKTKSNTTAHSQTPPATIVCRFVAGGYKLRCVKGSGCVHAAFVPVGKAAIQPNAEQMALSSRFLTSNEVKNRGQNKDIACTRSRSRLTAV